jgi:hypothetical protein
MSDPTSNTGTNTTTTLFAPTSRYYGLPTATLNPDGPTPIVYLTRRVVPAPERFSLLQEHIVRQGERMDQITARYLDDPEQFWRLCDANRAMHPDGLTAVPGRRLRITLPEGIPGMPTF